MRNWLVTIIALTVMLTAGCGDNKGETRVDKIKVLRGETQSALPHEEFGEKLRIELLGPQEPGMFGGKGSRKPVARHRVKFVPLNGSDLTVAPSAAETDSGGTISVAIKAGGNIGDQYLKVIPENFPDKSIVLRYTSGVKISGGDQEQHANREIADPVRVKVVGRKGEPLTGVPVFFTMGETPEGASGKAVITKADTVTNEDGEAEAYLKLGGKSGEYKINVEISDPQKGVFVRGQSVRILGINVVAVLITVLGGLTIFVFGMKLMGDGLQRIAGESMRKILQFFARNGIVAVMAGTLVTAVIQSSSATTVMVIGFINAGLLTLQQSIGIIFGANVGTTVTAQIISFNISGIALPAITIGFIISLSRKPVRRGWGETILGFGLLFFGMSMMSDELKLLGAFPTFYDFFQSFNCAPHVAGGYMPFGAVLGAIGIGIGATVLIQSSSAAMGIVLALAAGGLIDFYTAVPLLLGTNIGTTITAFLAALAANRVAKQAAIAHALFNIIGTLIMMVLFYVPYGENNIPVFLYFVNALTPGDVFAAVPQGIERHIAMAHTFFNVTVTIILMPFIGLFAHFCEILLPIRSKDEVVIQPLEPHLLATPSVALEQSVQALRTMVTDSWDMIDKAVNVHFIGGDLDESKVTALTVAEKRIDRMQSDITTYLVRITRRNLTHPQSELVPLLMHCTNDAERIADHAENIIKLTERMSKLDKGLSESAIEDIGKIWTLLNNEAHCVIEALGSSDSSKVEVALKSERKINKLTDKYESAHIDRLRKGKCNLVNSVIFIEMLGELEKIGDHLTNIAERTPEMQKHYIKL